MSVAEIAERSGVGERKTEVILHLLREAGMVRKTRRGFILNANKPPSGAALDALLQTYTERAHDDKDRLSGMMHYAESTECRIQIIRRYFNEPAANPCGRCDNCHSGAAAQQQTSTTQQTSRDSQPDVSAEPHAPDHILDLVAHAADAHHAGDAHDGTAVTRKETMHGTILTTAPETLPTPCGDQPCPEKGDLVRHKSFGKGTVKESHGDMALVHFAAVGDKKVKLSFLTRL